MASGIFQGGHFRVQDDAAVLDSAVVPAADDGVLVDEDTADRDASLPLAGSGFGEGGLHEFFHSAAIVNKIMVRVETGI